ncbi:TetR/AcrR family transcriptional regulator [Lysinimonas soli]|uniref:TetR/AcrR family transcriptional regulator n=1 Tax=Lysinimonas soli TaxID=1074233 RepID=A0ABW0NLM9_9MICO
MSRIPATERRAALARAALAVISRDGVTAATTRAIVAEAGMPLASFHYAYSSRDELLSDVIELVVADQGSATFASLLLDTSDLRSAVRATFRAYLDVVRADPAREQAMFELTQHALRTPSLAALPRRQYESYRGLIGQLLAAGAAGHNAQWDIPVDELAAFVLVITDGITLSWLADRDDAAAERLLELATEAVMAHTLNGAHA